MEAVTAYKDRQGRLHQSRRAACQAEFTEMVKEAWTWMPSCDKGDAATIAHNLLTSNNSRKHLLEALLYVEECFKSDNT